MDALNNLYSQLADLVRAMTPRARIATAVLAAVLVVSLGYLWRREMIGETTYLLGGQILSLDEITSVQGALGKAQLNDFTIEGNRIRIPQSKQAAYLAALADAHALPQTLDDVFSEATETSLLNFPSRQQQIEQMKSAKRKWITGVLRRMEGVDSAQVDFEIEEPHGLQRQRAASAVVVVELHAHRPLDEQKASTFRHLVSAALRIEPRDVTVVDKYSHAMFGGHGGTGGGAADDPYRAAKLWYQNYYEQAVRKSLSQVPGVTVSADVELEKELRREETRLEYNQRSTATLRSNEGATAVDEPRRELPGQPTAIATDAPPAAMNLASIAAQARAAWEESPTPAPPAAPPIQNRTTTETVGLTPKRVAISIGVPTSYFDTIWRQSHAADAAAVPSTIEIEQLEVVEIARIRQSAAGSIANVGPGAGTTTIVTVTPFTSFAAPVVASPSQAVVVLEWLEQNWGTVAAVALSLVFLLMLRSVMRAATRKTPAAAANVGDGRLDAAGSASKTPAPHFKSHPRERASRSLQEELSEMVRDDPAAAADVLRSWIGSAQ